MRFLPLPVWALALCVATAAAGESFPFNKYPAKVFHGKTAKPHLVTAREKHFRTAILKEAGRGPNFAGHYTIAGWGCGASCGSFVVIDAHSGAVYEPPELLNVELSLDGPVYRAGSSLLVLANCPPPAQYGYKGCERKYYNWNGQRLVLLRAEPLQPASG